jgi:hypothetical protein
VSDDKPRKESTEKNGSTFPDDESRRQFLTKSTLMAGGLLLPAWAATAQQRTPGSQTIQSETIGIGELMGLTEAQKSRLTPTVRRMTKGDLQALASGRLPAPGLTFGDLQSLMGVVSTQAGPTSPVGGGPSGLTVNCKESFCCCCCCCCCAVSMTPREAIV